MHFHIFVDAILASDIKSESSYLCLPHKSEIVYPGRILQFNNLHFTLSPNKWRRLSRLTQPAKHSQESQDEILCRETLHKRRCITSYSRAFALWNTHKDSSALWWTSCVNEHKRTGSNDSAKQQKDDALRKSLVRSTACVRSGCPNSFRWWTKCFCL